MGQYMFVNESVLVNLTSQYKFSSPYIQNGDRLPRRSPYVCPRRMSNMRSILAKTDPFEQPLELRTRVEAGQDVVDLVRLDILGGFGSIGIDPQPEVNWLSIPFYNKIGSLVKKRLQLERNSGKVVEYQFISKGRQPWAGSL